MTALDAITRAMRAINALASGRVPTAAEAADGLKSLNAMLKTWSVDRLTIPATVRSTYTLTAGTGTYLIGAGAAAPNFAQARPPSLTQVGLIPVGSTLEYQLDPMTEQEWAEQVDKTQTGQPSAYYFKRTLPLATLHLRFVPDAADTIVLYWPSPLAAFVNLTADYVVEDAYEEAMIYNLAVRLAPEYGRPLDGTVATLAIETRAALKRANIEPMELRCETAVLTSGGQFNIYTGE